MMLASLVGDDLAGRQTADQIAGRRHVVLLAGSEHEADRQAERIDYGMDIGTKAAS